MSVDRWIQEAVQWRVFARALLPPNPGWSNRLRGLLHELPPPVKQSLDWMTEWNEEQLAREHHLVLGQSGRVSPCESEHIGDRLGGKGAILSDVNGFYRAFGYHASYDHHESPDHVVVELSFLSFLALKLAYAEHQRNGSAVALCREARAKFLTDHSLVWTPMFVSALQETVPESFYTRVGVRLIECLVDSAPPGATLGVPEGVTAQRGSDVELDCGACSSVFERPDD